MTKKNQKEISGLSAELKRALKSVVAEPIAQSHDDFVERVSQATREIFERIKKKQSKAIEIQQSIERINEETFTIQEAASLLKVSTKTIRREITRNNLEAFKVGWIWRITKEKLKRYVQ